jgi:hypothetical protein
MSLKICCTQYDKGYGHCRHPAVKKPFLGHNTCILAYEGNDPRIDYSKCKIRIPYENPVKPPAKP